jgi:ankyrin repeat protein
MNRNNLMPKETWQKKLSRWLRSKQSAPHGDSPNEKSPSAPQTPNDVLGEAAKLGDIGGIRAALADGADIHARVFQDLQPLAVAVRYGHLTAIHYLLDQAADINANSGSALREAIFYDRKAILIALLDRGADRDCGHRHSQNAIYWAVTRGRTEIVKILLERETGDEIFNDQMFIRAVFWKQYETLNFLINKREVSFCGLDNKTLVSIMKTGGDSLYEVISPYFIELLGGGGPPEYTLD